MSVAVASVEKINALKTGIEATTGESYNDLTEAVQGLKNGYEQSSGGEVGKPYIDTSKMTDFTYFCYAGKCLDIIHLLDTSNAKSAYFMFAFCGDKEDFTDVEQLDFSKCENFESMFKRCDKMTITPKINTSSAKNLKDIFNACGKLKTAELDISSENVSNSSSVSYLFYNCKSLETVSLTVPKVDLDLSVFQSCTALTNLTIGEGWAVSIYLTYSNNLSVESLHGIIENLADLTGKTAKTFKVGGTNLEKIDEEHIAMLEAKNWAYS